MLSDKLTQEGFAYDSLLTTTKQALKDSYKPSDMSLTSLMYYGGYATIDRYDDRNKNLILKIPNTSIRKYLSIDYMSSIFNNLKVTDYERKSARIHHILVNTPIHEMNTKIDELQNLFFSLICPYPYDAMTDESPFQIFLAGIFFQKFTKVVVEKNTIDGRIDITINHTSRTFIIECKYNKTSNIALHQIKEKEYHRKIENNNLPKLLFGINLNKDVKTNNKSIEIIYDYELND